MSNKYKYLLYSVFFLYSALYAQMEDMDKESSKEFNFTVFLGSSILGPSSDYESQLKTSGLDDILPGNKLNGPTGHPNSQEFLITDIEAGYFFNKSNGLSLNFALFNKTFARGYENIGNGNHLFINSEIWSISMSYAYRTPNRKHNMYMGPAFISHSYEGSGLTETFDKKIGLYMGYSYQVIRNKYWFMALKMNYRMVPKSAVGPFLVKNETDTTTQDPKTHTSIFPVTEVNISSLNIGGSIGIKLNWNK